MYFEYFTSYLSYHTNFHPYYFSHIFYLHGVFAENTSSYPLFHSHAIAPTRR